MNLERRLRWYRLCLCLMLAVCGVLAFGYQRQLHRAERLRAELAQRAMGEAANCGCDSDAAAPPPQPPAPEELHGYPVSQPPPPPAPAIVVQGRYAEPLPEMR